LLTSATAHSRWPAWQPSWIWFPSKVPFDDQPCCPVKMAACISCIWFPSIIWQTPGSTSPIFWWLIGGDGRKVLFERMTSAVAHSRFGFGWLSDKRLGLLAQYFVAYGGDWRKVPVNDQRHLSFKMVTMAAILDLVSVDYLTNTRVDRPVIYIF
jgi:hypothetical protein